MSIELTAPLTFILTKFQPEKCHMGHVPTIFNDFHGSGIYPGPDKTSIYRSRFSGIARKVPEPSSTTLTLPKLAFRVNNDMFFRKLSFRVGKTTTFEGIEFERCARGFWKVGLPSTVPAHNI